MTGPEPMFDPTELLIDGAVERVLQSYDREFGGQEPAYPEILESQCRIALKEISRSDALYHDVHHTSIVTLVGMAILKGKRLSGEPVPPRDWLHFVLSLLIHDIGMVGGVCQDDRDGSRATGFDGKTNTPPRGATDAYLAPYHVDRGQLYARERFAGHEIVDPEILAANIERTRMPVPGSADYKCTSDLPGLVRAADLIAQLADPGRDRRVAALFYEFEEIGLNAGLGFSNPGDLRADSPRFFRAAVAPYVKEALVHLQATQEGGRWVASLSSRAPIAEMVERILSGARSSEGEGQA